MQLAKPKCDLARSVISLIDKFGVHSTPLIAGVIRGGSRQQNACVRDARKTRALAASKLEL